MGSSRPRLLRCASSFALAADSCASTSAPFALLRLLLLEVERCCCCGASALLALLRPALAQRADSADRLSLARAHVMPCCMFEAEGHRKDLTCSFCTGGCGGARRLGRHTQLGLLESHFRKNTVC